MTRPMPGPLEHNRYAQPHTWFADEVCALCRSLGRGYTWGKRLTDAECAAEYWRASYHLDIPLATRTFVLTPEWVRDLYRTTTLHRFATRPHALEES